MELRGIADLACVNVSLRKAFHQRINLILRSPHLLEAPHVRRVGFHPRLHILAVCGTNAVDVARGDGDAHEGAFLSIRYRSSIS
jgi:hypothetical protein